MIIPKYRVSKANPSIRYYRDVYCIDVPKNDLYYTIYGRDDHYWVKVSTATGQYDLFKSILTIPEMDAVVCETIANAEKKHIKYHIEFDTVLVAQSAFENQTELDV